MDKGIKKEIDLKFWENPIPPKFIFPFLKKELENINIYPDPQRSYLIELIAKKENIDKDCIYISNWIDGAIDIILKTLFWNDAEVIVPIPSFPIYKYWAKSFWYKIKEVALDELFTINPNDILKSLSKDTKIIFLCNPNNPTGNILFSDKDLKSILSLFDWYVVIDEAYYNFSNITYLPLLKKFPNLIVLRWFSKWYGLAWLRIWIIFANRNIIEKINLAEGISNKFVVNRIALKAWEVILEHPKESQKVVDDFINLKSYFERKLKTIKNIKVLPSLTSFSLIETIKYQQDLKRSLEENNILIKSTEVYWKWFPKNITILGVPKRKDISYVVEILKNILYS